MVGCRAPRAKLKGDRVSGELVVKWSLVASTIAVACPEGWANDSPVAPELRIQAARSRGRKGKQGRMRAVGKTSVA